MQQFSNLQKCYPRNKKIAIPQNFNPKMLGQAVFQIKQTKRCISFKAINIRT